MKTKVRFKLEFKFYCARAKRVTAKCYKIEHRYSCVNMLFIVYVNTLTYQCSQFQHALFYL